MRPALLALLLAACDESGSVRAGRVRFGTLTVDCGDRSPVKMPDDAIASGYVCSTSACQEEPMAYTAEGWLPPECQPREGVERWIEIRWLDAGRDLR